jgi:hypothetical protein
MATHPSSVRIPMQGRVQREGPHLCPHAMAFPSAMMSLRLLLGGQHRTHVMRAHGRDWRLDRDYFLHMGVSGEGFRFMFDTAEYFRFREADGAEPLLDCFAAEGIPVAVYAAQPVAAVHGVWKDEAQMRALVKGTLAQGFPVLVLGRTATDWVLLATGYEDGGETLVAWTFAPGADAPNKSFASEDCQYVRDWTSGVDAVALVTGMPADPGDRAQIVRRALTRGERFLRQAVGHPYGDEKGSYDAWTGKLRDLAFWQRSFTGRPAIDPEIWDLAERRAFCAGFLEEAAQVLGTPVLAPAMEAFHEIHDLMWRINSLCDGEDAQQKLRDSAVRAEIVGILRTCRTLDDRASDAIARALAENKQ